jgi:hypothetical protein
VLKPLLNAIQPEFPDADAPEPNLIAPDDDDSASALRIMTLPLPLLLLSPLLTVTSPPTVAD